MRARGASPAGQAGITMSELTRAGTPAPRGIAFLLAALAALGPFAIDTYLPSFPEIGARLAASPLAVQQTLSAYLLPFALMTLWHGALADALGRRRVVLVAVAVFGLASLSCAFATRIEHLWILRAVQGISAGAGMVVSRAIVRDLFDGPPAQRLMAQITMMFAFAPALAPLIGGWLQSFFGWRSPFVFLALLAASLTLACYRLLPETLPPDKRQSLRPSYLLSTYRRVLSTPPFLYVCGAIALNFAGFFLYVLSAPMFLMTHLGVSETGFLWLFGPSMSGLLTGSWISGRVAGHLSRPRTLAAGYGLMGFAACGNLLLNALLPPGLPWSVAPIFFYTCGMALAVPTLTLYALDPYGAQRGLAASCQTFLQAALNGIVAAALAPLLWHSTRHLAAGMAGLLALGALGALLHHRRVSAEAGAPPPQPSPPPQETP